MQTRTTPGAMLKAMREKPPLVQCITNYVAMNIAANVLLASGASPAMVHAAEEAKRIRRDRQRADNQYRHAVDAMDRRHAGGGEGRDISLSKPWVLDPVAHYATAFRRNAVADLLALRPTIIRGNASEIIALAGGESRGQGVDSRDPVEQAEGSARWLAERQRAVVAVTGAVDFVTDGEKAVRIEGGSALMPQVTALGCSLTCLVGAFAATAPEDIFGATVATLATFAIAKRRGRTWGGLAPVHSHGVSSMR